MVENQNKTLSEIRILAIIREEKTLKIFTTEAIEGLNQVMQKTAAGPAAELLLDRLEQLARAYPPDPMIPSHSSFRPAQALLYKDQIGFIDFDSFCQSEPANFHACFARLDQSQSR
jgi:hypothetical protein